MAVGFGPLRTTGEVWFGGLVMPPPCLLPTAEAYLALGFIYILWAHNNGRASCVFVSSLSMGQKTVHR